MSRRPLTLSLVAGFALLASSASDLPGDYVLSDDYAIRASTRGVDATFGDLRGQVRFDPDDLAAARFNVSVASASIATGNKTQDKHARGDSWLDVEAHPRITFESTAFAKTPGGYAVTGALTLHGHTERLTIPFTFDGATFTGTTTLDREVYGIDGPALFGGLVGDEIEVELRVGVK